jgi:2-C-methyl-D-erythritol 2,4-cyclodiphosphate synthase
MRVGFGYDVHALCAGRKLILGGVDVPFSRGLKGHSDADVLLHAVMDALLGAAALGDIGKHFPPSDMAYKDISSMALLAEVGAILTGKGFRVVNVDSTIVCEAPRLADFIPDMSGNISRTLAIDASSVGVKATTNEGLGFTGRGEGIAAFAVALVEQIAASEGMD